MYSTLIITGQFIANYLVEIILLCWPSGVWIPAAVPCPLASYHFLNGLEKWQKFMFKCSDLNEDKILGVKAELRKVDFLVLI